MGWIALLDSCVLYPLVTRDLLLRMAERYVYQVRWSAEIVDEVRRNLVADQRCTPEQAGNLVHHMLTAFPEAMVGGFEGLIPVMGNHPRDRHVLAAAVVSGADVIVTDNVAHFPPEACESYGIDVQTADEFLCRSFDLAPDVVADVFLQQVRDFRRPTFDAAIALVRLDTRLPTFVSRLRRTRLHT